ncbi:MAG: F0F1 ATP synthase subunit B [Gemmatimonas sp.]
MLIDWFTVGAQALNFLILVLLLRHFLYGPILAAIAAREKLIAGKISDATAKDAEATRQRDEYQKKNEAFDTERTALLKKATDAARTESERLLNEARNAAEALSAKRAAALRSDAQQLRASIRRTTQDRVFAIARKTLADLASTTLEQHIVDAFAQRFRSIDPTVKSGLSKALAATSEPAVVRSAFALPAEQQAVIQMTVNETMSDAIKLRFETAPDLVSGIELTTNGQRVAWNIANYIESLSSDVDELLQAKDKVPANATDTPPDTPTEKRADKPSDKPTDKPSEKSTDTPIDKPADKPALAAATA